MARDLNVFAVPQPGQPYFAGQLRWAKGRALVDCPRGIPCRLKVVDQAGKPIDAEVEYRAIFPNPIVERLFEGINIDGSFPFNRPVKTARGIYEGFVLPGPGAVLVKTTDQANYLAAHVDPKAYFAPGRTTWTNQELITAYGTEDTLIIGGAWIDQHDYAAIALVNPPADSTPLELSAQVIHVKPRLVSIVDPEGKPVLGVKTEGLTAFPWDRERHSAPPRFRSASFARAEAGGSSFSRRTASWSAF